MRDLHILVVAEDRAKQLELRHLIRHPGLGGRELHGERKRWFRREREVGGELVAGLQVDGAGVFRARGVRVEERGVDDVHGGVNGAAVLDKLTRRVFTRVDRIPRRRGDG